MKVLLDNTVLSNFLLVRQADLLQKAFRRRAHITESVYQELQKGIDSGLLFTYDWSWLPVLKLDDRAQLLFTQLSIRLNDGEASCLALAAQGGYQVFTDDRDARKIAAQMGIPVSGTLGVLVLLIEQKEIQLDEGDVLLKKMIQQGYFAPISSLATLLQE
jgi:predicted nucleic acid-binding protein